MDRQDDTEEAIAERPDALGGEDGDQIGGWSCHGGGSAYREAQWKPLDIILNK
jgi:hypothetical protein